MNKLYQLSNGLGTWFVVAPDPTAAQDKLHERLDRGDGYGFFKERVVTDIKLISEQITDDVFGISDEKRLLL